MPGKEQFSSNNQKVQQTMAKVMHSFSAESYLP
jgi:hypothetical protein